MKIEPVLDIDLETKARGVDVILTVSGPLSKLNLTPRSDPPLQFSEIVALLATGAAPTSDPTLAVQQSATPTQSFQQLGASALLGQALANPVAGRLQRFFGVTKLRIDPTPAGRGKQPAGAPDDRAAGDAGNHVHLHHQHHQQQSAGGARGVGAEPDVVGGGAARRERAFRHGFPVQEEIQVRLANVGCTKIKTRQHADLRSLVIGSGPGGQRAAIQAAKSGKRVALVEKREVVGGVCINTGTIPSKTMREAVLHLSGYSLPGHLRNELSGQGKDHAWRILPSASST